MSNEPTRTEKYLLAEMDADEMNVPSTFVQEALSQRKRVSE